MIKALIFDFDGLIVDTESPEFQAWQEVFNVHGHELRPELWADLIGRPRTYFDMYAHFKELNGPRTDLEALRKERRARSISSLDSRCVSAAMASSRGLPVTATASRGKQPASVRCSAA